MKITSDGEYPIDIIDSPISILYPVGAMGGATVEVLGEGLAITDAVLVENTPLCIHHGRFTALSIRVSNATGGTDFSLIHRRG